MKQPTVLDQIKNSLKRHGYKPEDVIVTVQLIKHEITIKPITGLNSNARTELLSVIVKNGYSAVIFSNP